MRRLGLLVLFVGCYHAPPPAVPSTAELDADFYRREAERQRWEAQEAELDRRCAVPPTQVWASWCAWREREKDRAAQRLRAEQEQANAAAILNMQQKLLEQQQEAEKDRQLDEIIDRSSYRR